MKHFPSEKYNIAWFKLSECVLRGEKERALGVYRLLAHSIEDPAFALQLEGDLLLAFQDEQAVDKYVAAARAYEQKQRFVEAAAVYEHLMTLQPEVDDHVVHLAVLYQTLNFTDKMRDCLQEAIKLFVHGEDKRKLTLFLQKLQELSPQGYQLASQLVTGAK